MDMNVVLAIVIILCVLASFLIDMELFGLDKNDAVTAVFYYVIFKVVTVISALYTAKTLLQESGYLEFIGALEGRGQPHIVQIA